MDILTPFDPWKSQFCTCVPKYQLSPYTGCGHRCAYCYISAYIPNPFEPRPKKEFLARLQRDIARMNTSQHVSISNSSDPYTPPEEELGLTRETLRLLLVRGLKVQLITKSNLVVRDLDVIRKGNCAVSITVTTLDPGDAAKLEPGAPSPQKRIEALSVLSAAGVPTIARIDPLIPGINDENFEQLVKEISKVGVRHVVASTYKMKADSFSRLVHCFPYEENHLRSLFLCQGQRVGRGRYLPEEFRRRLMVRVRDNVVSQGLSFGACREGFPDLVSAPTCDGSHLIPDRKRPVPC